MRDLETILDIEPEDKVTAANLSIQKAKDLLSKTESSYNSVFMAGDDQRFYDDFEDVRETVKDIIGEFRSTISKLSLIALDTEKSAHFAALSQMATTLLQANKQLLDIYIAKKKYYDVTKTSGPNDQQNSPINVKNAIFTGTTSDLKKWIDSNKDG